MTQNKPKDASVSMSRQVMRNGQDAESAYSAAGSLINLNPRSCSLRLLLRSATSGSTAEGISGARHRANLAGCTVAPFRLIFHQRSDIAVLARDARPCSILRAASEAREHDLDDFLRHAEAPEPDRADEPLQRLQGHEALGAVNNGHGCWTLLPSQESLGLFRGVEMFSPQSRCDLTKHRIEG